MWPLHQSCLMSPSSLVFKAASARVSASLTSQKADAGHRFPFGLCRQKLPLEQPMACGPHELLKALSTQCVIPSPQRNHSEINLLVKPLKGLYCWRPKGLNKFKASVSPWNSIMHWPNGNNWEGQRDKSFLAYNIYLLSHTSRAQVNTYGQPPVAVV